MTKAPSHERHAQLLADLGREVESLQTSDGWHSWLQLASRFRTYSLRNQLLILSQRPDATRVAGYRTWKALGRQVKAGEHGIAIIAPVVRRKRDQDDDDARALTGFRIVHVFDVAQTEGQPLVDEDFPAVQVPDEGLFARLLMAAEAAGFKVVTAPPSPGEQARGWWQPATRSITLIESYDLPSRCRTLLHELAHAHDPAIANGTRSDRAEGELVAESATYLVGCGMGMGLAEASAFYLSTWGCRSESLAELADQVLAVASAVERAVSVVPSD